MIRPRRASGRGGPERGFTLLELIVACGILALIAVFSWRGLDSLIREREALAASQRNIDALQRLFARIERDALVAGDVALDGDGTMVLVAGSGTLDGGPASAVRYRYGDGVLQRSVGGDGRPSIVLGDVSGMTLEAWSPTVNGGNWVRARQPVREAPTASVPATAPIANGAVFPAAPQGLPPAQASPVAPNVVASGPAASAIRVTFTRTDGLPVMRTFLVGGG